MAKKVARREVGKAKRIVRKKQQWTVAAGAFGYHAGYDSKEGFYARRGHLLHQGGVASQPVGTYTIPASSSYVFKPFYTTRPGPRGGLIVCGTQNIGQIASTALSTAAAFVIGGSRTALFYLSPDDIGGPMALDARKYNFYRFKKVKIICPMNASSTDTQNMAIAYLPDPASATFTTIDYNTMQQATDLFVGSRKQLNGPVVIHLTMLNKAQFKKYNTEIDTTDSMSIRACRQGVIYGIFDATDTANLKYGDIVMEYELELYDRCPDYGFTVQITDLPLLSRIQREMVKIISEQKSRGDSDESIEKRLPRWKSQLRQIDRYIRTHLPSVQDDPRFGNQTCLVGPDRYDGSLRMAGAAAMSSGGTIAGLAVGGVATLGCNMATDGVECNPSLGTMALGTTGRYVAIPSTQNVGTTTGMSNISGGPSTAVGDFASSAVKAGTSGIQSQATFTVVPTSDMKIPASAAGDTKSAPVSGASTDLSVDEKKLSANALRQLPLLRSLSAMTPDRRRTAMKDIVTYGYDTVRKAWPPILQEYPGPLRQIATQLVEMSEAESRRQDDSESSDDDDPNERFEIIPSDDGPTHKVSYGEFRLVLGEKDYTEYLKLRAMARVAQRSFSLDPTDQDRKIAMSKCQKEITQFLRGLAVSPATLAMRAAVAGTSSN